jgi:hypothetical protein
MSKAIAMYRTGHISRTSICASTGSHHSHELAGLPYSRFFWMAGNIREQQAGPGYGLYVSVVIGLAMGRCNHGK